MESVATVPVNVDPAHLHGLMIDMIDVCQLRCGTCPRGTQAMPNNVKNKMSFDLFQAILQKARYHGVLSLGLHNWIEPFLQDDLFRYVQYAKKLGMRVTASSNFSLPQIPHLIDTLRCINLMWISVSGFTQDVYGVFHKGGNIEYVKRNILEMGAAIKRGELPGRFMVKFLDFGYNSSEIAPFRAFAEDAGVEFVVDEGVGNPLTPREDVQKYHQENSLRPLRNISETRLNDLYINDADLALGQACFRVIRSMTLDYKGDAYLCCSLPNLPHFRVGNFLEDDIFLLQARRDGHLYCRFCHRHYYRCPPTENYIEVVRKGREVAAKNVREERARLEAALAGTEVYFYGMGRAYHEFKRYFKKSKPKYILLDPEYNKDDIREKEGIPVAVPQAVLGKEKKLPIIVFVQDAEPVIRKIREAFPQYGPSDFIIATRAGRILAQLSSLEAGIRAAPTGQPTEHRITSETQS